LKANGSKEVLHNIHKSITRAGRTGKVFYDLRMLWPCKTDATVRI